jgi:chemotaxis protein CheX
MEVRESELVGIVERVWQSLGLCLDRIPDVRFGTEHTMTAVVQITGSWQGATMVRCTSEMAHHIGAAMFGIEPGSASSEEVQDALGEVANMIAGNFKSLLPPGCQLSLPAVVEGRDYRVEVPGAHPIVALAFTSFKQPFQVGLLERKN